MRVTITISGTSAPLARLPISSRPSSVRMRAVGGQHVEIAARDPLAFGCEQFLERPAAQIVFLVAEQPVHGFVGGQDAPFGIENDHAVGCDIEDGPKLFGFRVGRSRGR